MNANEFLEDPLSEWEPTVNRFERMGPAALHELERDLTALAVRAARASAYISRRMTGGKHADAVKRQNAVARKVRQALGYTYADDKLTF